MLVSARDVGSIAGARILDACKIECMPRLHAVFDGHAPDELIAHRLAPTGRTAQRAGLPQDNRLVQRAA